VQDTLIAAVDGLTGFPDAINAVFPDTEVQLCIVHMVRNSVKYVPFKDRKAARCLMKKCYRKEDIPHLENVTQIKLRTPEGGCPNGVKHERKAVTGEYRPLSTCP
jgi:transposase-like protein